MLNQGYETEAVASRTGLSLAAVDALRDHVQKADVSLLVKRVHERLRDLGLSQLAASKMGKLSRSTLATLGKDGKIPSETTLAKLDDLLSWESGSARSALRGGEPIPREVADKPVVPDVDYVSPGGYANLAHEIEVRLRELNMSKTKFAAIGGPGRSTLATLGKRGYQPAPDTLERIDRFLLWEPGSALAVLKGGLPIRRGPTPTPHPSLVPLNAVLDRLRRMSARLARYEQGIQQMQQEVGEAINHVTLAISDLGDPRRREVVDPAAEADRSETNGAAAH
ncbi:hypothetical protein A5736_22885 [Mycobacterium sp. SP-6446]|nr:hypothetical protein A5736_22885 [Mycobacterium sp. SP-6446]